MVKLIHLHKADSIYEDEPDVVYDFPGCYLKAVAEGVGDWVIYYEPVKSGPKGYFAVARIENVIPKPHVEGRYLALIATDGKLHLSKDQCNWPHPENLRWHRENIFGQVSLDGPAPWS